MELCQILCQFLHVCGRLGVTPWLEEEIVQPYYSVITRGVAQNRQVYFRIIIIIIHLLKLVGEPHLAFVVMLSMLVWRKIDKALNNID